VGSLENPDMDDYDDGVGGDDDFGGDGEESAYN